ncbi:MAG: fibronectin type III domain-containing protein, partial [bacterium]|nr:fibronectin type III domain-containing protein [bacterium]
VENATGYTLAASTAADSPPLEIHSSSTTVGINVTTATVHESSVLNPNTTYYLFVKSNKSGESSSYSNYIATSTLADKPVSPAVQNVYESSATISWTDVECTGYRIYASTASDYSGEIQSTATTNGDETSLTVEDLYPNNTYYFRTGSLNWHNAANYASNISSTTLAQTVGDADIYSVYWSSVTVNWTAFESEPSSATCSGYVVEASSTNFGSESTGGTVYSSTTYDSNKNNLTVTDLSVDTTYWFRIGTYNLNDEENYAFIGSTCTELFLAVDITTITISLGTLEVGKSTIVPAGVPVKNASNIAANFAISATTSTVDTPWQLSTNTGMDEMVIYCVINSTKPSINDFDSEDILEYGYQTCTTTKFSMDNETGEEVPVDEERQAWFLIKLPTVSNTADPQELTIKVKALKP